MYCKNCPAYGIDNLGFHGCLIKHTMLTFPSGKSGCKYQYKNILKNIEYVKEKEPRNKHYKWRDENKDGN